jgi:hypothetical protein
MVEFFQNIMPVHPKTRGHLGKVAPIPPVIFFGHGSALDSVGTTRPIEMVTTFKYLGRILTSRDNDWEAAYWHMKKAKQRWATISRVLACESASPRVSALFYKAVIQTVLLYG